MDCTDSDLLEELSAALVLLDLLSLAVLLLLEDSSTSSSSTTSCSLSLLDVVGFLLLETVVLPVAPAVPPLVLLLPEDAGFGWLEGGFTGGFEDELSGWLEEGVLSG